MKVYQKIILILMGLLLLPLTFLGVNAENFKLPENDYLNDPNFDYFIASNDDRDYFVLYVFEKGTDFIQFRGADSFGHTYVGGRLDKKITGYSYSSTRDNDWKRAGSTIKTYNDVKYESTTYDIIYSSRDVLSAKDNTVVFKKKLAVSPARLREIATTEAVQEMEKEVQETSGTILVVGGQILGLVLVLLLVNRLIRWGVR